MLRYSLLFISLLVLGIDAPPAQASSLVKRIKKAIHHRSHMKQQRFREAQPFSHKRYNPETKAWESVVTPESQKMRATLQRYVDDNKMGSGVVVGRITKDGKEVFSYGRQARSIDAAPMSENTMFELGSVSKTYTSLALASMAEQGIVHLDDPIRKYLPVGSKRLKKLPTGPNGEEITLRHLATHTSGLPEKASDHRKWYFNIMKKLNISKLPFLDPLKNPYSHYGRKQMYRSLSKEQLKAVPGSQVIYSNIGTDLLAHTLTLKHKQFYGLPQAQKFSYDDLIQHYVTHPLGLRRTRAWKDIALVPDLAQGYRQGKAVPNWSHPLQGSSGIFSDATNQLRYLESYLGTGQQHSLTGAMKATITPNGRGLRTTDTSGLAWQITPVQGQQRIWHNGATGGHSSYASFTPQTKEGLVILSNNTSISAQTSTSLLAKRIHNLKTTTLISQLQEQWRHHAQTLKLSVPRELRQGVEGVYKSSNGVVDFQVRIDGKK